MPTKILVVDDDQALCELVHEVLTWNGMDAQKITDSSRAAALLRKEKFDAVFLDVRMPSPNGIELTRQIRGQGLNRRTPIVVITGEDDPGLLKSAFEAGADFFLFKPIDRQGVLRLIRATEGTICRERRRFHRVPIRLKVALETGNGPLRAISLDLSLNGALLQTGHVLSVRERVGLAIELKAGHPPVRAAGEVVRLVGDDCIAVQFEPRSQAESERLQEFLLPRILADMKQDASDPTDKPRHPQEKARGE